MPLVLPDSARLAWWGTSVLRGHAAPDDLLDHLHGDDVPHRFGPLDGVQLGALEVVARLRAAGATEIGLALPVEGDLAGCGGPAPFNLEAVEQAEAAICATAGVGWVPHRVSASVTWVPHEAARRQLPDVGEADRALRAELNASAARLADLDVAAWRPEIADELLNLRRPTPLVAPSGVPPRCVALAQRALVALGIVDLASDDDGGAISADEIVQRRGVLRDLERAGRHALVAACSPEVWPPG